MAADGPRSLIDGEPGDLLPISDRGFAYGDGIFRTVRVDGGRPWLWSDHMAKLLADCRRLGLPANDDLLPVLRAEADALAAGGSGILRLVMTRGSGPRGDRPPANVRPRRVLSFHPVAEQSPGPLAQGVRLCRVRLPMQPELAGIKHLNRLPQVLARSEWGGPSPAEGLLFDHEGALVCGTMSNVFLRIDQRLLTPRLDRCGVAGVVRARLLHTSLPALVGHGVVVEEARLGLDDLQVAEEVWLTNAVIGLWSVASLEDADGGHLRSWPDAPAPLARSVFADLATLGDGA